MLRVTGRKVTRSSNETAGTGSGIELSGVDKVYRTGRLEYRALRGVDLSIEAGELVAIVGPSGSGKSTILNIITGIDRPTAGAVTVAGERIDTMTEEQLAAWRGANVGIVFQFFQLIPVLTALENAILPLEFNGNGAGATAVERATGNLQLVGLGDRLDHLPAELSGGEQQRVAVARALANQPKVLVADEPTGNLDSKTANHVMELLVALNRDGTTVVYVTHDPQLARFAHRVVAVQDGRIIDRGGEQ